MHMRGWAVGACARGGGAVQGQSALVPGRCASGAGCAIECEHQAARRRGGAPGSAVPAACGVSRRPRAWRGANSSAGRGQCLVVCLHGRHMALVSGIGPQTSAVCWLTTHKFCGAGESRRRKAAGSAAQDFCKGGVPLAGQHAGDLGPQVGCPRRTRAQRAFTYQVSTRPTAAASLASSEARGPPGRVDGGQVVCKGRRALARRGECISQSKVGHSLGHACSR